MKISKKDYKKIISALNRVDNKSAKISDMVNDIVQEQGKLDFEIMLLVEAIDNSVED